MDTAGIDIPNSRAIAKQLLTLSQDPDNQPFIVQEQGCLAGLVQYTQHEDIDVVLIATRALQFLSSNPKNRVPMREFTGLIDNVRAAQTRAHEIPRLEEFARGTLANLGLDLDEPQNDDGDDEEEKGADCTNAFRANKAQRFDTVDDAENCGRRGNTRESAWTATKEGGKGPGLAGGQSLATITLAIDGLDNSTVRAEVETAIIKVPGVISVTANPTRGFVRVGTRDEVDVVERTLVRALSLAGHLAKVVVGLGEAETKQHGSGGAASSGEDDSEYYGHSFDYDDDEDYPEYLEEEDYDDDLCEDGARVARHGFSSLEARLEQQRKEEEARKLEKSSRLIGKMSSALSNASSWLMGY